MLLSISSLAPKRPSIMCHGIFFSPAALTPGCLWVSHSLCFSLSSRSPLLPSVMYLACARPPHPLNPPTPADRPTSDRLQKKTFPSQSRSLGLSSPSSFSFLSISVPFIVAHSRSRSLCFFSSFLSWPPLLTDRLGRGLFLFGRATAWRCRE